MFATFCPARRDRTEAPTLQAGWTRGQVNDNLLFMNAGLAVVLGVIMGAAATLATQLVTSHNSPRQTREVRSEDRRRD
jgi:hypothetical protein